MKNKIIFPVILIILITITTFILCRQRKKTIAAFKHQRCSNYTLQEIEIGVNDELGVSYTSDKNDFQIYSPCDYTYAQNDLETKNYFREDKDKIILTIDGVDELAAKDRLWSLIKDYFGPDLAEKYSAKTWLDYNSFQATAPEQGPFILKKNVQRQTGLLIVKTKSEVKSFNDYILIQKVLDNPYLVEGYKTNFRVYVLITCDGKNKRCYVYNDGFMYYGKEKFTSGTTPDQIITTGYISREMYAKNPLTLQDLYKYMDTVDGKGTGQKTKILIQNLFKEIFPALAKGICRQGSTNNIFGQLYGCDVQLDDKISGVKLIECNKGPSLQKMDERDTKLKTQMVKDYYGVMGIGSKDGKGSDFVLVSTTSTS